MRVVPSNHGWGWLVAGWQLFRASPGMWTMSVFTYWLLVALVEQVRYIGPLVVAVSLPAFSVSFMAMCETVREGKPPRPALLFAGFQRRPDTLLILGGLYLLCIVAVLAVSALVDGGVLFDWMLLGKQPPQEALENGRLLNALLVAALAATPVLTAFWFAPVLAAWDDMGAAKSLFFSFFGCWRNWRAFLVYGAALGAIGFTLTILIALAAAAAGGSLNTVRGMKLGATLVLLPTLFGSFYAAYRDIFPRTPSPAAPLAQSDSGAD